MLHEPLSEAAAGKGGEPKWTRFAHGLHEPLGLAWKEGWLYVVQRPDVSRLRDADGDGRADIFEVVADGWGISGEYHEYAFGTDFLPEGTPNAGDIFVTLCLTGSFNSEVPFRGWGVRVTADGRTVPAVSGVRSPGGMDFNARGDVFYSDNQGPWNGTCAIKHLAVGSFAGHPGGLKWFGDSGLDGEPPAEPKSESRILTEAARIPQLVPPAVMLPYDRMGKSTSGIVFDRTLAGGGKFGPWTSPDESAQAYVGDQSHSTVMRMSLETVGDWYQGAVYPMLDGYRSGNLAMVQAEDGSLFVGGTNRGWGSRGTDPFAVERTRWTGVTPPAINHAAATAGGLRLTATVPLDESAVDPASYETEAFTYIYQASYGSPEVDAWTPKVTSVERVDERTVDLTFDRWEPGFCYHVSADAVRTADGRRLWRPELYYTLNRILTDGG